MEAVGRQTVGANTQATIQTTYILLILFCTFMIRTPHKELLGVKSFQPCRLSNPLIIIYFKLQKRKHKLMILILITQMIIYIYVSKNFGREIEREGHKGLITMIIENTDQLKG